VRMRGFLPNVLARLAPQPQRGGLKHGGQGDSSRGHGRNFNCADVCVP
jgi:hypothetical protein